MRRRARNESCDTLRYVHIYVVIIRVLERSRDADAVILND